MKLLFAIPHYCDRNPGSEGHYGSQVSGPADRGAALKQCVESLHQQFGRAQGMIHIGDRRTIAANQAQSHDLSVIVVTSGHWHALVESNLQRELYEHLDTDVPAMELGFRCHQVLAEQGDEFDYFAYMDDDLTIRDPWWFDKLSWFNRHVDHQSLLMANRYELAGALAYKKCYIDGDLSPHVTKPFQNVSVEPELRSRMLGRPLRFIRSLNPHSGCFFLNRNQLRMWRSQPNFGVPSTEFIGALESAATLGIMRRFRLYKPANENANFFEIEHHGRQFISKIRQS